MSELARMIGGYQVTQALHVAAVLGIADLLAEGQRTSDELAAATGADAPALYRLLRALARVGLLDETSGGRFSLTELGGGLRDEEVRARLVFLGRSHHWDTWSSLLHSVRTGENSFRSIHGCSVWEYRAEHAEESEVFDAWMAAQTRASNDAILSGFDFGRFRRVVDVGGGHGAFLAAILAAHPDVHGTLFDQAHVVAGAPTIERCEILAGSFFDEVPAGGDAYVLKWVIHDWRDVEATTILRTVARAVDSDARVLVIERDLNDPATAWVDLQMLVMTGGQERTENEYAALFRAAGLDYVGATPVARGSAVYEAHGV
jgi:hypothetical protein